LSSGACRWTRTSLDLTGVSKVDDDVAAALTPPEREELVAAIAKLTPHVTDCRGLCDCSLVLTIDGPNGPATYPSDLDHPACDEGQPVLAFDALMSVLTLAASWFP